MHHKMLHRALLREEARPVVLGMAQHAGGHYPDENLLTSDSEDSALVTSDEEERGEPGKIRLCMQMVPVEAASEAVQGLHTLYDWGSTVTLVRRESARRLGFRPAQVAQRMVNGLGGTTVTVTGCHFLPLIDVQGKHQVVCAFEVEEITTVAETRLPPLGQRGVPVGQGAYAVDGHASGSDRVAHRVGQLAVATCVPGRFQRTDGEHEADKVLVWARLHDNGRQGHRAVPQR